MLKTSTHDRTQEFMMGRDWIEVRIKTDMDAGELAGLLNDPEMAGAWQEEGVIHLYWPSERWTMDAQHNLTALMRQVTRNEESFSVHSLPEQDWNRAWARSVVPFRVGRRIVIRPSWQAAAVHVGDVELILDPKQAFGTGHHATTQLILEWLEAHIGGGERVLDIGTGSGILAMAALRLGAASAWGIDHDPAAVECASEYAGQNNFGPELRLKTCELTDVRGEKFDLVLANLDGRTLRDMAAMVSRMLRRNGTLVLSGILCGDRQDITAVYRHEGGILSWEEEREGWLALAWVFLKERV